MNAAGMILVYFFLTIFVYCFWRYTRNALSISIANPLLLSILSIIALLYFSDTSYQQYMTGGAWLSYLIEPSVVALGYPLYRHFKFLRQYWLLLLISALIASFLAMTTASLLAQILGLDELLQRSIASLCITTAVSMDVAERIGGSIVLAALLVMIAGIGGSVIGLKLLSLGRVTHPVARGIAMGSASHALGTATVANESSVSAAFGSVALILAALGTALVAPYWVPFILSFGS